MTPDEVAQHVASTRAAWLKMLQLCLTELGVDESLVAEFTGKVGLLNPRRRLRVTKIRTTQEAVHLYGEDPSFVVEVALGEQGGATIRVGDTITYVRDGPHHGVLVPDTDA